MALPKVIQLDAGTVRPLRGDRGVQVRLVGPEDGATNLDVHVNVLNQHSGPGAYHYHERAENVYIVLEGWGEAVLDGKRVRLGPGSVTFIPPGVRHSFGSDGTGPLRVLEIYAPAGPDFHVVPAPDLREAR